MKNKSSKQSKMERDNAKWRKQLIRDVGRCQNPFCTGMFPHELCVNEAVRGTSGRKNAYSNPLTVNVLCGYCNTELFTDYKLWPPQRQCALQIILCRDLAAPQQVIDAMNACRGDTLLDWKSVSPYLQLILE